jgi:hypothetical protein
MKRSVNRKSEIVNEEWLPDMDLNHDKQIQSLLCYRYTIGQTDLSHRLENFACQSSRQAGSTANGLTGFDARPHPGPLPRGEGEAARGSQRFDRHSCNFHPSAVRSKTIATTGDVRIANKRRTIPPLLEERVGVRASVITNFSASRPTPYACCAETQRRRTPLS